VTDAMPEAPVPLFPIVVFMSALSNAVDL